MNRRIINRSKLRYLINEEEKTAGVIGNRKASGNIIIPYSIKYESNDYIITSILEGSFQYSNTITSVQFSKKSQIQAIEKNAFLNSIITSFTIPPTLTELKEGWCDCAIMLNEINVMPGNPRYSLYENKFIIGKSSSEIENYDVLVFCKRNIEKVQIPNFIKIIGSYSFGNCSITTIEFPVDSRVEIIEKNSFIYSSIQKVTLPSSLTKICEGAFKNCHELKNINIPFNSNLTTIEKDAFFQSTIENFTIPSNCIELKEGWCSGTSKIKKINVMPNNQLYSIYENKFVIGKSSIDKENFDVLIFCLRNINYVAIPNFIEIIGPYSFDHCRKLHQIEIPNEVFDNSRLKIIDDSAFEFSSIEKIIIPKNLIKICKNAFSNCIKLQSIEISNESNLQIIEKNAFNCSSLENLTIPSNLVELQNGWCKMTSKLTKINILPKNQFFSFFDLKFIIRKSSPDNADFDVLVFCLRDVKKIKIPSFIKRISSYAFSCCQIQQIEFSKNSELNSIEKNAFSFSSIKNFHIPFQVTKICKKTFYYCNHLIKVEIPMNSKIEIIEKNAFSLSSIESIFIPFHVKTIKEAAFCSCKKLRKVEIQANSELQIIEKDAFSYSSINSISIPSHILYIDDGSFQFCGQLLVVEILSEFGLKVLNGDPFFSSKSVSIFIPFTFK